MSLSFSYTGGAFAILLIIPEILYRKKFQPTKIPPNKYDDSRFFLFLETIGLYASVFFTFFYDDYLKALPIRSMLSYNLYLSVIVFIIIFYYMVCIRYLLSGCEYELLTRPFFGIPIPLAVAPTLIFFISGLWLRFYLLSGVGVVYGIGRTYNYWVNYKWST
jgi:hypothetical protein